MEVSRCSETASLATDEEKRQMSEHAAYYLLSSLGSGKVVKRPGADQVANDVVRLTPPSFIRNSISLKRRMGYVWPV